MIVTDVYSKLIEKFRGKNVRFFFCDNSNNPTDKAFNLIPELYEKQADGTWKHKKSGLFFLVDGKPYVGEPGNYSLEDIRLKEHLEHGGNYSVISVKGELSSMFQNIETVDDITEQLPIKDFYYFEKLKPEKIFIVDGMIRPKTLNMLYSPPGEFKSLIALDLAMAVASGKDFMKIKTKKFPVLYCDKENNEDTVRERLIGLYRGRGLKRKKNTPKFLMREGDIFNKEFIKKLAFTIKKYKIKLIIFDTLHRFGDYQEDKADDVNRLYKNVFQPLIDGCEVAILFIHHSTKTGGYRGSSDFLGMVDTSWQVTRKRNTNTFTITNEKGRRGEIEKVHGEIIFNNVKGEEYIKILRKSDEVEKVNKINKLRALTDKVEALFTINSHLVLSRPDISARLDLDGYDFSETNLKRCLDWLVDKGFLEKDESQKTHRFKKLVRRVEAFPPNRNSSEVNENESR